MVERLISLFLFVFFIRYVNFRNKLGLSGADIGGWGMKNAKIKENYAHLETKESLWGVKNAKIKENYVNLEIKENLWGVKIDKITDN